MSFLLSRLSGQNDVVVVSVFVNPLQFGPAEDLARYPRDWDRDAKLLREAEVDAIYRPAAGSMYAPDASTRVHVSGVTDVLEGVARPGHFEGVTTVVTKLFAAVHPDRAYIGQKDAQQVAVVKRLVRDLDLGVEIEVVPTDRAPEVALHGAVAAQARRLGVRVVISLTHSRATAGAMAVTWPVAP